MTASLPTGAITCGWAIPGNLETDKYILPVSGGADSTALAIYLHERYPHVPFELIFSDTGAEEQEAYDGLRRLEEYLGKTITWIKPKKGLFDLIEQFGGFLPSSQSRWCTRELKLAPFRNWMKQHEGIQKWMFVGIRADESSRVAFTIDECETIMPFVELGLSRADVFAILTRTVGVPKTYQTRTRSGCGVCPFQRKSEIVGLLQRSPSEFQRGANCEKLSDQDQQRHEAPVALSAESGIAANWLHFPKPKDNLVGGRGREQSLFATSGVFVGVEFFYDGMPFGTEFIWHQRLVSFSSSLAGIKRQLQDRFMHLLRTSEVYDMTPDDVRHKAKFAIYFVEAPSDVLDTDKPDAASYTWQAGQSYRQTRHVTQWAMRILHAAGLEEDAARMKSASPISWVYENAMYSEKGLKAVKGEKGAVVASLWYQPTELSEEDEEIEEKFFPCPMCQI